MENHYACRSPNRDSCHNQAHPHNNILVMSSAQSLSTPHNNHYDPPYASIPSMAQEQLVQMDRSHQDSIVTLWHHVLASEHLCLALSK
jgi:hypothetical protein